MKPLTFTLSALALITIAASQGCGVVDPVVRVFTGEPTEPLVPKNAPTQPTPIAISSSSSTYTPSGEHMTSSHPTPTNSVAISMAAPTPNPVQYPPQPAVSQPTPQGTLIAAEAEPGVVIREAAEPDPRPERSSRFAAATGRSAEIFPTSSTSVRRPGMTSGERFDIFGALPSSSAPAAPTELGFDDAENLAQISFATEGRVFDPAVGPQGELVYFASTLHAPTADIYAKSVQGTAVTKLTSSAAHDIMPAINPDGTRLAFASNRNGSYDIYITNADGGGQAAQITFDSAHELHPSWSPDGTLIAYCRLGRTSDRWEIWVADAENPGIQKFLTYGLFPEWHPTENTLLFQRSRDRGDRYFGIWTIRYVDGEALSPTEIAASSVAAVINPSWSSSGDFIAFSTILNPEEVLDGEPQVADLWIARSDGSQRANLTGGFFANLMPTWGPQDRLFFISDRSGNENIWSIQPRRAIQAATGSPFNQAPLADVPIDPD